MPAGARARAGSGREPAAGRRRQFVAALARGLEVLRCFGPGDRQLGNQEIARRTGLPKPTVSRLTATLTELGYLRSAGAGKCALGTAVLGLGLAALGQMDVRRIARPLMQALAEHTRAAVNLGVRDRLSMIYVDTYRNAASFTIQLDVGSAVPIATTSMGRAYLCALAPRERAAVLDALRRAEPAAWPRVRDGFERALRQHDETGLCVGLGDWRREIHAVAAPLALPGGDALVFSCSGAAFELPEERLVTDVGPRLLALVGNVRSALAFPT